MEENNFENLKSMLNGVNIPNDLQNILSNIASSNQKTESSSEKNSISPEAINNLISMLKKRKFKRIKA